jgi:neutral ceramidase
MKTHLAALSAIIMFCVSVGIPAQRAKAGPLKVGAAKVDITPAESELPKQFLGVLDHLYSRAIVVDNGTKSVALVTLDAGAVPTELWRSVSQRIETELGIPATNVFITATHTHSAPFQKTATYTDNVFKSVKMAKEGLQPARMSYGTGLSYINVQRDMIDEEKRTWWEGANYAGLSDKTVAVIRFESLTDEPIAVYYNYAVHAVITGTLDLVSGDIPGASSRYIEDSFDNKVVALWSEGASGDQNPIYFQQTYDLRQIRIKDYASRGQDISNAMPPGGQGLDRADPTVAKLMNQQKQMILSMGQLLGEEVLHVMRNPGAKESEIGLYVKQMTASCPGRERTNEGRGGAAGTYTDGKPVEIRLGLLMIGEVAIGAVDAEVYNEIAQRLKRESPYARTMMATLTNGMANSGYIPDDASYGHYTFEVLSSRLQPGCAEKAIVNGIIGMMPTVTY